MSSGRGRAKQSKISESGAAQIEVEKVISQRRIATDETHAVKKASQNENDAQERREEREERGDVKKTGAHRSHVDFLQGDKE